MISQQHAFLTNWRKLFKWSIHLLIIDVDRRSSCLL